MKLLLNFNHIQAAREASKDFERDTTIEYPMDLYIQGVKKENDNRAIISFRLQTTTNPEVASFTLSGDLLLEGTGEEVEIWTTPSTKGPPKVWKHIYQESMNILTVLAKVIDIPFPTPKIGGIEIDHKSYQ